jgi:hypothetical protein
MPSAPAGVLMLGAERDPLERRCARSAPTAPSSSPRCSTRRRAGAGAAVADGLWALPARDRLPGPADRRDARVRAARARGRRPLPRGRDRVAVGGQGRAPAACSPPACGARRGGDRRGGAVDAGGDRPHARLAADRAGLGGGGRRELPDPPGTCSRRRGGDAGRATESGADHAGRCSAWCRPAGACRSARRSFSTAHPDCGRAACAGRRPVRAGAPARRGRRPRGPVRGRSPSTARRCSARCAGRRALGRRRPRPVGNLDRPGERPHRRGRPARAGRDPRAAVGEAPRTPPMPPPGPAG